MPTCWFARLTLPQTIVPPVTNVALLCSDYALARPLLNKLSSAARVEVASRSIARRHFFADPGEARRRTQCALNTSASGRMRRPTLGVKDAHRASGDSSGV